jgi:2-dehydropantoate 2-reductase
MLYATLGKYTMIKTKIVIAGIGGVGGYFGGLLAKHFYDNENIEISFVARGEHLKEIQKNGLRVIKGENEFIIRHLQNSKRKAVCNMR